MLKMGKQFSGEATIQDPLKISKWLTWRHEGDKRLQGSQEKVSEIYHIVN